MLLGPLEVRTGETVLALGGARQRSLLALLLLRANEVVSRDRLIEELWGERSPQNAGHRLDTRVSRLRKALNLGEKLVTRPGGYALEVVPMRIDVRRFERLLERGRRARTAGSAGEAADTLREALALWRGGALADLAYEPFARVEIERLEELRMAAIEERIEADLALGCYQAVVSELEALVAEHPLRERLRGQLMRALYGSGRQVEALAAYSTGRRLLVEELGLDPSPELQQLERAILNQDPALAPKVPLVRAKTNLPTPPTLLLGRQRELAATCGLLRRENLRLLTLTGPAGTGKTRLALAVGAALYTEFPDGVLLAELAPINDPALLVSTITQALAAGER